MDINYSHYIGYSTQLTEPVALLHECLSSSIQRIALGPNVDVRSFLQKQLRVEGFASVIALASTN